MLRRSGAWRGGGAGVRGKDRRAALTEARADGNMCDMRVIALEEHFWTPEIASAVREERHPGAGSGSPLEADLADLGERRLAAMDAAGIDLQVISHTAPGVQSLDPETAVPLARAANDRLARAVREHPDRFAGFATLPMPAPEAAADELERTVAELGFKGAMINGHTAGRFLDDPAFAVVLERAERLGMPLYLHPAEPVRAIREAYYDGLAPTAGWFLSAAAWGWHAETGLHVLRMVLAGVFDRHPRLQLVIGHMGEMLPFMLARIDDNLPPRVTGLDRLPSEYILANVHVTTSGLFTLPPLLCTLMVFGADRVLFSVDWPYASNDDGRRLLDSAPLSPADLERIAHGNAERLLGLDS
jgi:predicted TIM-barrel fold metal-dependent hydrolase